jgi:hypothetical protein
MDKGGDKMPGAKDNENVTDKLGENAKFEGERFVVESHLFSPFADCRTA